MKDFALLLESLLLTPARNAKIDHMVQYFRAAPDPDRGYALAVLTGALDIRNVKSSLLRDIVLKKVDPTLFEMSYDYVGDLAETIALIWPDKTNEELPGLAELIIELDNHKKSELPALIARHLSAGTATERWAIMKLATGNLRVGVSARLAKTALAQFGSKDLQDIEKIWHGIQYPYTDLFAWLEDRGTLPEIQHHTVFHPMMLSNPIDEEKDFNTLDPKDYQAEWKWDGIRIQLVLSADQKRIFSRTGDDVAPAFPDILEHVTGSAVLDGELLVGTNFEPSPFNDLQQRLNRKAVTPKMLDQSPAFIRVYDILFDGDEDLRDLPLSDRRKRLEAWIKANPSPRLDISPILEFKNWKDLLEMRVQGAEEQGHEGIMLKRHDSPYVAGRPKGPWFKWKRDPCLVDAVLMYAQRGHGKRSSYYSDYTFGVWKDKEIVPVGKAYSGFTDEELVLLDKWVRNHTTGRFGPVREVEKKLVFEVAFDSAHTSNRHRSGIALRFPRINRIRWDKPPEQADTLANMQKLIETDAA